LHVTFYKRLTDTSPEHADISFEEFCERISRWYTGENKEAAPGWGPYLIEGPRRDANVKSMSFLVLDVDGKTEEECGELLTRIKGLKAIIHTTHSHNPAEDSNCMRVILPLAKPVQPSEWRSARESFLSTRNIADLIDPNVKDLSRFYFVPSSPNADSDRVFEIIEGVDLELIGIPLKSDTLKPIVKDRQVNAEPINLEDLRERIGACDWGRKLNAGDPIGEPGERNANLMQCVNAIARYIPTGTDQEAVEELFANSIANTDQEDWDAYEDLARLLASALPWWEDLRAQRSAEFDRMRRSLQHALSENMHTNLDENGKYKQEDLERWALEQGCTLEEFKRRWIITFKSAHWIFCNGVYKDPAHDSDVIHRAHALLNSAPVELWFENPETGIRKPKRLETLRFEYGTTPGRVIGSLEAARSRLVTDTFVEAFCPLRDLTPTHHKDVEEWLRLLLVSPLYTELLLDWIATITELGRITPALYLHGETGCGKSLLAQGLSRLWSDAPAGAENFFAARFNSGISNCPLLFADEKLPKVEGLLARICSDLSKGHFQMERKFFPVVTVKGSPRLLIAANDSNLLGKVKEELTSQAVDALTSRFLIAEVSPKSKPFLETLGMECTAQWGHEGTKIAEHALWLRDNREVDRSKRWLIQAPSTETHLQLTLSGYAGAVMQFIVRSLEKLQEKTPDLRLRDGIRPGNGKLLVRAGFILEATQRWKDFVGDEYKASPKRIGESLRDHLSNRHFRDGQGGQWFYEIKLDLVRAWINLNGLGDWESIETMINKDLP